ncbi:MAG: hypothetical protein SGI88_03410 [Candidatus Hydrogenedentes bacterium]|nr:hypothetical protein [Candidatus Hydrogenedentota bacterium]
MGIHAAHNVATLQVLVSSAATHLANNITDSETDTSDPANTNSIIAFTRLMRELRASIRTLASPQHTPFIRQNNFAAPTPEGIFRHAQRAQHDTGLDPDSIADAQLPPQTNETHAHGYLQHAIEAGAQGRDVEMCEAFDNAARLDEPLAEMERDHVLACYRPAKQSVSEELAAAILGNLHLPPLPKLDENGDALPTERELIERSNKFTEQYLDLFQRGKIPPEAFPLDSKIRKLAEAIFDQESTAPEPVESA